MIIHCLEHSSRLLTIRLEQEITLKAFSPNIYGCFSYFIFQKNKLLLLRL